MHPVMLSLVIIFSFATITWLLVLVAALVLDRYRIVIPTNVKSQSHTLPKVSILVPARNEAGRCLDRVIQSMLEQDYPNFDVIVVDDCSTDETLQILTHLATKTPRLRVIKGEQLPHDWIPGKMYALEQARILAEGDWVLIADADVIFSQSALASLLCFTQRSGYDVVSIEVEKDCQTFWEKLTVPIHRFLVLVHIALGKVNKPGNGRAFGGGCILVRTKALEAIGGFASVKDQVPDILALTCRLKGAGYRFLAAEAPDLFRTRGYGSFREIWEGHGKDLAPLGARIILMLPLALVVAFFTLLPPLSLLVVPLLWISVHELPDPLMPAINMALLSNVSMIAAQLAIFSQAKGSLRYALVTPIAYGAIFLVWLGAAFNVLAGRGLKWKGRRLRVGRQSVSSVESSWLIHR
ncbi:MAG: glycosyltransferase family 2 protein [Candidatus Hadarchaeum sp.]